MEKLTHSFTELFKQLGLPHSHEAIESFLKLHRPLNASTRLEDASFWSPSQSHFLKEQLSIDSDWAELIDQLSVAMRSALNQGIESQIKAGVQPLLHNSTHDICPNPFLAEIDAKTFITNPNLQEEVFGPTSLIVWTDSVDQTIEVLRCVGGSLTVTFWGAEKESESIHRLVSAATEIAGRVLFAGVPTGVAVTAAQQHGGPWPSSTEPMTTSVGDAAMDRFLRPVSLQDMPEWLRNRKGRPC